MLGFFIVGFIGVILLVTTLVIDDIFESIFDNFEFGDGIISGPAIAGFLSAFGFGGALASYAGLGFVPSVAIGVLAGVTVGGIAGVAGKSAMNMPTDATPRTQDLEGLNGFVVTKISEGTVGEVMIQIGGQPVKLTARSSSTIESGKAVVITQALSPTSVIVELKN